jgi:hypothetical protein
MGNIIILHDSKILRSLLRGASNAKKLKIFKDVTEIISIVDIYRYKHETLSLNRRIFSHGTGEKKVDCQYLGVCDD